MSNLDCLLQNLLLACVFGIARNEQIDANSKRIGPLCGGANGDVCITLHILRKLEFVGTST